LVWENKKKKRGIQNKKKKKGHSQESKSQRITPWQERPRIRNHESNPKPATTDPKNREPRKEKGVNGRPETHCGTHKQHNQKTEGNIRKTGRTAPHEQTPRYGKSQRKKKRKDTTKKNKPATQSLNSWKRPQNKKRGGKTPARKIRGRKTNTTQGMLSKKKNARKPKTHGPTEKYRTALGSPANLGLGGKKIQNVATQKRGGTTNIPPLENRKGLGIPEELFPTKRGSNS